MNGIIRLFPAKTSDRDKNKRKRKSIEPQSEEGDEPFPIDVLADTIIGFLEKGTAFLRTVANQSFSLLSARLKRSTIELILTVGAILSRDTNNLDSSMIQQLERRDPTQEGGDEDEDEEMEDEESAEEDSSSEGEDDEDEEDEKPDLELRSKIEEALRASGIELANSSEGEDDSEEEEVMDDDQMMAIDGTLAEIFRSRVNEKKAGKGMESLVLPVFVRFDSQPA